MRGRDPKPVELLVGFSTQNLRAASLFRACFGDRVRL